MLRGVDGFQLFDTTGTPSGTGIPAIGAFDIGTSAPGAGYDIELRYNLTDQNGANLIRKDIILAVRAMQRLLLLEAGLQQPAGTYTLPGLGI